MPQTCGSGSSCRVTNDSCSANRCAGRHPHLINDDFREFFALLNARRVELLVIGGVAYNFHASPRATKDIDLRFDRAART
jgi:hypothetical protein